ncbi:odorant receptor 33b-like [Musca vetustissima]|uniref:odorant receptor 33b-like n=1 Tax=Musca vetustissima TaxID=27455 RepID=UPI002AB7741D|nr:odorant receptor 33b-like [Musca vetustissima]
MLHNSVLHVAISFWYPMHLTLGLLSLPNQGEIFKNLSITITCIVCTMKHILLRMKLKQMRDIENLLVELDDSVGSREEYEYFTNGPKKYAQWIAKAYLYFYMGANVAAISMVLLDSERRLMYPAWFPFDWNSSSLVYWSVLMYQFMGVTTQIVQNLVNDASAGVLLCLMSGHVHLLSMRVSRIGHDSKKMEKDNLVDLEKCVEDHLKLIRLFKLIEDTQSYVQLIMYISNGLNICVAVVYLIFFVESRAAYPYYVIFILAISFELYPSYYYGSICQQEFNDLTYSIFCSNWTDQSKRFRKNMMIFVQNTLAKVTMKSGGIVEMQIKNFFAICKMTYSLFTLVRSIK